MPKLQKILKALESRALVKLVKSSASATKRIYMLAELVPSEELTGGQWCATLAARACDDARCVARSVALRWFWGRTLSVRLAARLGAA
jgi:RNA polymerase Rpc34 subunit